RRRRSDAQAPQGVAQGRRAQLPARRLQPLAVDLRPRRQVRPPRGRGLHHPARPLAARVQPAARGRPVSERPAPIAKTEAGGAGLLPEVLAFTSSLPLDRQLLREDLLGSLAHLTMLARRRVVPQREAQLIRQGLAAIWSA